MKIDYIKLQKIEWNTIFNVEFKSNKILIIRIEELIIDEVNHVNGKLIFEKPKREWAMLWNEKEKDWENHPDIDSPIGNKITAFYAKMIGENILISFGGNHSLGLSRWGFYVDEIKFEITEGLH